MPVRATLEPTAAAKSLRNACRLFLVDLNALPEDAFEHSFGPKVRTVADLAYEVNLVNDHVGHYLRGEPAFDWPKGWIKAPAEFAGKAEIIRAFQESSERIMATADSYTQAQMDETIPLENGEGTRESQIRFIVIHLWYHLGQLNFIQTLLGDDVWHWME